MECIDREMELSMTFPKREKEECVREDGITVCNVEGVLRGIVCRAVQWSRMEIGKPDIRHNPNPISTAQLLVSPSILPFYSI